MSASTRWSVQIQAGRPRGVLLAAVALALTATVATGASVWMWAGSGLAALVAAVTTLAVVGRFLWRYRHVRVPIRLAADALGNWSLYDGAGWRAVVPSRFWRGPYWITLALTSVQAPGGITNLTVWRGALAERDWRKLCVLLRARPARGVLDIKEPA